MLVRVPQQLLPLAFGGGDDGGGDHAFLFSFVLLRVLLLLSFSLGRNRALGKITAFKERERDSLFKVDSTLLIRGTL